jgi:hypothetical protein
MSRSLRRISRNQGAQKALLDLTNAIPKLQGSIRGIVEALPAGQMSPDVQALVTSLVEDCQTLARENKVMRETFLRLLILLGEDSEENIRKVEAEIRANLLKEHEDT